MRNIEIMLHDGMIGPKSVLLAISCLTTGNLNSKLKQGADPYKMENVLPMVHEYIIPPLTKEEQEIQVNSNLLSYLQMHPKVAGEANDGLR